MSANTLRMALVASRNGDDDTITLFGALSDAASELRCIGDVGLALEGLNHHPTKRDLGCARAAALNAIAALDAYENGETR